MMCKLKGWMEKGGHYYGNQRVGAKGGITMCELKGRIDKGGHYDVQMKRCLQKGAI